MESTVVDVAGNLEAVRQKVAAASTAQGCPEPMIVAVSKTKPIELLKSAWDAGQRHFGENYVAELIEKGPKLSDVQWHFIGHLQSNKVKTLVAVPGLWVVETVDSVKLANMLNKEVAKRNEGLESTGPGSGSESTKNGQSALRLRVMVQVNTSGESTKSGALPQDALKLAQHIHDSCPALVLHGVMAIGRSGQTPEGKQDFQALVDCRASVAHALGVQESDLQLSMGMSHDFEDAIAYGSTSIRVGTSIFGKRDYSNVGKA